MGIADLVRVYLQDAFQSRRGKNVTEGKPKRGASTKKVLSGNVLGLGLTSLFTDISSEMVVAVTPLYLTATLGFSIASFGVFEGVYQGVNASLRLWGGSFADRHENHKKVATTGYAISALTRVGLLLSTFLSWLPVYLFLLADRVGKGVRVAPRDALISLSVPKSLLATAFGVHRTLDTIGALIGPFVAYLLLEFTPGAFDSVFVVSVAAGLVGVSIIWLLVNQPQVKPKIDGHVKQPVFDLIRTTFESRQLRRLAVAVGLVSFMTIGDSFIYLIILRKSQMNVSLFPLLYSGTAVTYILLAVPVGRIADKVGKKLVFILGHVVLLVAYLTLAMRSETVVGSCLVLGLLGGYYAATDGMIAALASSLAPSAQRGTTIAAVSTSVAVAKLCSAAIFGVLWQKFGIVSAVSVFGVGLLGCLVTASVLLRNSEVKVA